MATFLKLLIRVITSIPRAAWIVALAHIVLEICNNFLPIVYPIFIKELGLTYTQVGIVALVAGVSGTLTQPFFGYLSDRWGARRLTVFSVACIGTAMGLIGFVQHYPLLLLLAGIGGIGSAAFHPAGASVVLTRSRGNRRGRSASVFSVSGNIGAALSPIWITTAIALVGIIGTVTLIPLAIIASLLLHQQLKSAEKYEIADTQQPVSHTKMQTGLMMGLVMVVMAVMSRTWFQMALVTYLPEWIQSQGYNSVYSGQILFAMLLSVGIGSLIGGTASDYIGRWQVILISMILLVPTYWLFMLTRGPAQIALSALIGVLVGTSFPVALVMAQDIWPSRIGLATSLVIGVGWVTGGMGAAVTGFLADEYSLTLGLQSLLFAPMVGVLCIIIYAIIQKQSPLPQPAE